MLYLFKCEFIRRYSDFVLLKPFTLSRISCSSSKNYWWIFRTLSLKSFTLLYLFYWLYFVLSPIACSVISSALSKVLTVFVGPSSFFFRNILCGLILNFSLLFYEGLTTESFSSLFLACVYLLSLIVSLLDKLPIVDWPLSLNFSFSVNLFSLFASSSFNPILTFLLSSSFWSYYFFIVIKFCLFPFGGVISGAIGLKLFVFIFY